MPKAMPMTYVPAESAIPPSRVPYVPPVPNDNSYAHTDSDKLPPYVNTRIRHSLLMHEAIVTNISTLPSYARDLGSQSKFLARRVLWDTDRDLIFPDEIIHGSAMLQNMRNTVPPDIMNVKIQYFRRSEETDPGLQTSYSDPASSDEDYSEMPVGEPSSDEELGPSRVEFFATVHEDARRREKRAQRRAQLSSSCNNRQAIKRLRAKQWNLGSKADGYRCKASHIAAPAVLAPPDPDDDGTVITNRLIEDRVRARSLDHLMCHSPPCATCEGCQARARAKKHHKGSVEASPKDRTMIITMDQLSVQDFDYTAGYGGFK